MNTTRRLIQDGSGRRRGRRRTALALAAAALAVAAGGPLGASDLPRGYGYRGPETNGVYPATGLLRAWPAGGPKLLWKASVGLGACPVAVVADKVYAIGGKNAEMHAFTLDGQPLGRATLGSASWKRFGFSRSTPLVAEGVAVGTTPNGNVFGIDLETMATRWQVNAWKNFGSGNGSQGWGMPESPILHGSLVIFNAVSRDDETPPLVAIDIRDGYKVWGMDPGNAKAYSAADVSAAAFRCGGRSVVAAPTWCYVTGLNADTGKVLWELPGCGEKTLTPVYDDGMLLVSINRALPDGTFVPTALLPCVPGENDEPATAATGAALTPRQRMRQKKWGPEEMTMLRLSDDGATCRVAWVRRDAPGRFSHAVMLRKRIYCFGDPNAVVEKSKDGSLPPHGNVVSRGGGHSTRLLCLDAETGLPLAHAPAEVPGHVVAAEGMVYAVDLVRLKPPGGVGASKASPRIRLIRPTGEGFEVAGEFMPFTYENTPTGDVEWNASVPPVIAAGRLFFRYGPLLVYDIAAEQPASGWRGDGSGLAAGAIPPIRWGRQINVRWQAALPGSGGSAAAIGPDRLYLACRDGTLACLDAESGKPLWNKQVGKPAVAGGAAEPTPVAREGVVFAAAGDGTVACFAADGTRRWQGRVAAGASPAASPLLSEDLLIVQAASLHGLAVADGKQRWQVALPPGRWGTPVKGRLDGTNVILTAWGTLLRASDGQTVAEGVPPTGTLSPVIAGRTAYCASAAAQGSRLAAVRLPETAEAKRPAEAVWSRELKKLDICCSPLASGGLLYVLGRDGRLVALDADSGNEVYDEVLFSGGGGDAAGAALSAAGGRVYVEGLGADHRTLVLKPGRKFAAEWSYAAAGPSISAFRLDRQYVRVGKQCFAIGGATPAEPRAPQIVELAGPLKTKLPAGVPASPLNDDVMPKQWLFAGPIPQRSLEKDFLAGLGGREKLVPAPGTEFTAAGAKFRFAPLEPNAIWQDRHSGDRPTIDLTAAHHKKWQTTGYYFTVLTNDKPRYVTFKLLLPDANPWKARLDTLHWLAGAPIAEKQIIRLLAGQWPLMIQAGLGECEPWGKIFMLPRFLDITAATEQKLKDYQAAAARWQSYQAEPKSFVLGGPRGAKAEGHE